MIYQADSLATSVALCTFLVRRGEGFTVLPRQFMERVPKIKADDRMLDLICEWAKGCGALIITDLE